MKTGLGFLFGNLSQKVITNSLKLFKKEHRKGRKKTGNSFRRLKKKLETQSERWEDAPKCGVRGHGRWEKQLQKREATYCSGGGRCLQRGP